MRLYSQGTACGLPQSVVGRVTLSGIPSPNSRADYVLLWKFTSPPTEADGYAAVLTPQDGSKWRIQVPLVHSLHGIDYIEEGDVARLDPNGYVRTLFRRGSPHNFILATDQCNSYCLMCSQPPKKVNDFDRLEEHLRLIDLIDRGTKELVITGGEPTLLKDGFLRLLSHCKEKLPCTAIHVLTNGRLFYYREFAEKLAAVAHPDLMLGIPIYSDIDSDHDYIVQAKGAFEETVTGLQNLGRYNVCVEVRIVLHALTCRRLPQIAEFIARNFPFAAQVVLMGMEMIGFVHKNMDLLWVDPHEYQGELLEATRTLYLAGMNVKIYNHQLCILDRKLWSFACKSISDWKNIYLEPCAGCVVRARCGGFFESAAKRHSSHIQAIKSPIHLGDSNP